MNALIITRLIAFFPPALFVVVELEYLSYPYKHLSHRLPTIFSLIDQLLDVNYFFLNYEGDKIRGINILIGNSILLTLIIITLMRIYFTDPGRVPKKWSEDRSKQFEQTLLKREFNNYFELSEELQQRIYSGDSRQIQEVMVNRLHYCKFCKSFKPERAGHCFELSRCILRFQSYFYLIASGIGYYNYKFYYLSLLYTTLALSYLDLTYFLGFLECWVYKQTFQQSFTISLSLFLASVLTAAYVYMLILHSYLICKNLTVSEMLEKNKLKNKKQFKNKYDLGTLENIKSVLGDQPYLWFLPTTPNFRGKGLQYDHSRNNSSID